jgi:hypothetical protein
MAKQRNLQWEARLRRQHRLIALYSLIQCWVRGADGLVLTHDDLTKILNIKRLEWSHFAEFASNVREFFPFVVPVYLQSTKQVLACFISRRKMEGVPKNRRIDIPRQIAALKRQGVDVTLFSMWKLEPSKTPLAALKPQLVSLAKGGPNVSVLKYVSAR